MRSQIIAQRDFSGGQIDDTALRADDTDIHRASLRRARNCRILASRAARRRPGRRQLFTTTGICEVVRPNYGSEWFMVIEPGQVRFISSDLATSISFGGYVQIGSFNLTTIRWVESGGTVILCHQSFRPLAFTFDPVANSWAPTFFSFSTDPSGSVRQPYYNYYLGSGVTLTPSARSGTINLTFSGPVLSFIHIGVIFRYCGRQILITGVTSSTTATGLVVEELPPLFALGMDNVAGLQVGDVVEGVTSGAKGQVVLIIGTQVNVLVEKNWAGFELNEAVAGPRSKMKATVVTQLTTTVASTQWDEALMSDYRGWPGCVSKDAQRIIFTNFRIIGAAVAWSSTGTLNDFAVGAEKEDAILEFIPDNCQVLDVVSGADEFVITDVGLFYVPVSTGNPLIPGSIDFRRISDDAAANVRPRATTEGVVFVNASLTRIMAVIGTGQTARPYIIEDLSEFHSQLVRAPFVLATTAADTSAPERYIHGVNWDGTFVVGRYQKGVTTRGWVGWVPWDGVGRAVWVTAGRSTVVATIEYGPDLRAVEVFDDALFMDAALPVPSWGTGSVITVMKGSQHLGTFTKQADGSLAQDGITRISADQAATMKGGYPFSVEVEPFVPHADPGISQRQRMRRRRLLQVAATVQRTQAISVAGKLIPAYNADDNMELAPPLRNETYRHRPLGRDFDPRWSVEQVIPGEMTILELTTEVTV
ncbi:hypothetical protein [Bosea sp. (in: a-proteobacteria)]|uniref:hypothetical protein n=1 Tax=Bosea sp. (in: a-proteobacteria) TaxID=1871050 RepID=UPI001AC8280F|nr:hypothetical protein [Bosea sp. (in: a-proteobacteria)]MBN9438255.1 hypothetical protein [Bosea sp. (in: a-proteobacteria)]